MDINSENRIKASGEPLPERDGLNAEEEISKSKETVKKTRNKKYAATGIIVAVVLLTVLLTVVLPAFRTKFDGSAEFKNANPGDIIKFGRYIQNNPDEKEDIEWRVLDRQGNRLLIICEKGIDSQQFNNDKKTVTWETCSLRAWLNETFINEAFSVKEQKMICETPLTAERNPEFGTSGGRDTEDRVFLLSLAEANKYFGDEIDGNARCYPTNYAVERDAGANEYTSAGWWWLRSPGIDQHYASFVTESGNYYATGFPAYYRGGCVRPALWIEV